MPGIPTEAIFTVVAVTIFMSLLFLVMSGSLEDLAKQLAQESAEVVARDLAGFITISAAAPESLEITYEPSEKFSYDVDVNGRIVSVRSRVGDEYTEAGRIFIWKVGPIGWEEKTALDLFASLDNEQIFVIEKTVSGDRYVYKISGGGP